ncbi:MAG TPA: helix-turn-helix transcriptional regulator [Thermoanaerobaculia bacterium]
MLNKTEEPGTLRLVVVFLRFHARMTQTELGKAVGVEQALISRYESGQQPPPEDVVRRMAGVAGIPWALVMYLRRTYSAIFRLSRPKGIKADFMRESLEELLDDLLLAMGSYLAEVVAALASGGEEAERMRREAEEIWMNLRGYPMSRRRRMLELSVEAAKSWAMAERLCDASLEALPSDPEEALALADLALWIAQQVEGEEAWRSLVQGYCWAHISHARRAAGDAPGADEAAARAWKLWDDGSADERGLLSGERMLDLLEEGAPEKWHAS